MDFNDTRTTYPKENTLHGLFEAQVSKTPDQIAVCCGDERLSYGELNRKANQLARLLQEKGIKCNTIVGVMLERSSDIVLSALAVLKAGGAYLPLDPDYPFERINFMLKDSDAKVLLTQSRLQVNRLIVFGGTVIHLDEASNYLGKGSNLKKAGTPVSLAYIIYTSGTTGKPKGVMIEHRNVVRLLFNNHFQFDFHHGDVWTLFHSFSFDFSVWEMYGALLYGGRLVIVPKTTAQDPQEFLKLLKKEQVTVLNQIPIAFYSLAALEMECEAKELVLRYIIFGGEALQPIQLKAWRRKYPETKLINMYGITETTVHVTYKEIDETEIETNTGNIGRPIPTLGVYLLDQNMRLIPEGVTGEIYVSGDGVGRGYLNRPELTAERFIVTSHESRVASHESKTLDLGPSTFGPSDLRLYRSGDLARRLPNGEMEYMGRADHQVKVRGYRIELGEIEYRLLKHGEIKEAVALIKKDNSGNNYICAYLAVDRPLAVKDMRKYLEQELPDYMIPSFFVFLERMPLTLNGKIDRKALPEPNELSTGVEYEAPINERETVLVEIWEEVLGVSNISVHDNFFELGGDSIKGHPGSGTLTKVSNERGAPGNTKESHHQRIKR